MSIFDKINKILGGSTDWVDELQSETQKNLGYSAVGTLDTKTLLNIHAVIDQRAVLPGVVSRSEDYVELEVSGESFYQNGLHKLANGRPGLDKGWVSGFLLPEPSNKHDRNAVAVYLIDLDGAKPQAIQVGYLSRETSQELGPTISKHMAKTSEIVPLLGRIFGGEPPSKPNYGVTARVFWDF
jgi:hypothetical protein